MTPTGHISELYDCDLWCSIDSIGIYVYVPILLFPIVFKHYVKRLYIFNVYYVCFVAGSFVYRIFCTFYYNLSMYLGSS
jgi:hypothetical protein